MICSQNTLRIIYAAALKLVMEKCQDYLSMQNPGLKFEMKGVGSREGAKWILSGDKYDIIALADQALFAELLVPDFVNNYFVFASDQIVIGYNNSSSGSKEITKDNWVDTLLNPKVSFARSDHHLVPRGYRTLMVWQLAEIFYNRPGLYSALEAACEPYTTYPQSLDLSSALFNGQIDYAFLYSSEAKQLGLPYIALPSKINLSNPAYASFYDQASVIVDSKAGNNVIIHGKPIEFAIGLSKDSSQPKLAQTFVDFLTGTEGSSLLDNAGFIPC